jgi:hypothetical protein
MQLVANEGDIWTLCAESVDDSMVWQISFEDVRQAYIERVQQEEAKLTNSQIPPKRGDFEYEQGIYEDDYPYWIYRAADRSIYTFWERW